VIFLALGIGLVLLIALGWAWVVFGGGSAGRLPDALPRTGVFGAQSRTAWPGGDVLVVDAADLAALTGGLVATLARQHRVILAAPPSLTVPPCFGGPVFRTSAGRAGGLDPQEVGDVFDVLADRRGPPIVVVVAGQGADAALADIRADLPRDVDLRAVLPRGEGEGVSVTADGDGYRVHADRGAVRLRVGPEGFQAAPA